jgi:hypothetical protein
MIALGVLYLSVIFFIALATLRLHQASGEVLPKFVDSAPLHHLAVDEGAPAEKTVPQSPVLQRKRKQLVAQVITDRPEAIAQKVLEEMKRGVTALAGKGMYTGQSHSVLLIALTVTEAAQLKALVQAADPNAFMIVIPAQEVLGRGFQNANRPGSAQ